MATPHSFAVTGPAILAGASPDGTRARPRAAELGAGPAPDRGRHRRHHRAELRAGRGGGGPQRGVLALVGCWPALPRRGHRRRGPAAQGRQFLALSRARPRRYRSPHWSSSPPRCLPRRAYARSLRRSETEATSALPSASTTLFVGPPRGVSAPYPPARVTSKLPPGSAPLNSAHRPSGPMRGGAAGHRARPALPRGR